MENNKLTIAARYCVGCCKFDDLPECQVLILFGDLRGLWHLEDKWQHVILVPWKDKINKIVEEHPFAHVLRFGEEVEISGISIHASRMGLATACKPNIYVSDYCSNITVSGYCYTALGSPDLPCGLKLCVWRN